MDHIIGELILGFAGVAMAVIGAQVRGYLKTKYDIEIEAKHREALHSAAETVVKDWIIEKTKDGSFTRVLDISAREVDEMIRRVGQSVPDALAGLRPSKEVLRRILTSKFRAG